MNKIELGDWVRFYQDGKEAIGSVEYLRREGDGRTTVKTNVGVVLGCCILEVRRRREKIE